MKTDFVDAGHGNEPPIKPAEKPVDGAAAPVEK